MESVAFIATRHASPLPRRCQASGLFQRAKGLRGTDRPRPLRKLGSLSAPRLCGDILEPMPPRLTSVSAAHRKTRGGLDLAFPVQAAAS